MAGPRPGQIQEFWTLGLPIEWQDPARGPLSITLLGAITASWIRNGAAELKPAVTSDAALQEAA